MNTAPKNAMKKLFLSLSMLLVLPTAWAFPMVWSQFYGDQTSRAMMVRDNTANLYVATRHATLISAKMTVEKFNAAGVKQWSRDYQDYGRTSDQYYFKDMIITPTHVYVAADLRGSGGAVNGDFVRSRLVGFTRDTGTTAGDFGFSDVVHSIASNGTEVVALLRSATTSATKNWFLTADLTSIAEVPLGNRTYAGEVRMDSAGKAYAFCGDSSTGIKFTRSSSGSGLELETTFDPPIRTGEDPRRVEIDPVAGVAYCLIYARYSPSDYDVLLGIVNLNSGALVNLSNVVATVQSEFEDNLLVVPNAGVIASARNSTAETTTLVRRSTVGSPVWTQTLPGFVDDSLRRRPNVLDADGNLLLPLSESGMTYLAADRVNIQTGADLGRITYVNAFTGTLLGATTDVAGNLYVNSDMANGVRVARVQAARLTFSANNVTGGTPVNATIELAGPATSDQVWAVTTVNPNLVEVPPTATVTSGNNSVTFPITVKPVASNTNVSVNIRYGGFINQVAITLVPSLPVSLSITPQVVIGGVPTTGTITLNGQALNGGQTITLASNKPLVASVPANVVVPAGQSSANFPITTYGVNSNQGVVITATQGAVSKTAFFAVNAPSLTSISVNPTTLKGGVSGTLTLNISGVAPTGGFSIVLVSGAPGLVILSASASVNAGQTSRTVSVPTAAVSTSTSVLIFATRSGIYRTTTLTVTP